MSLKKSNWHYPLKLTKRNTSFCHKNQEEYQPKTLHYHNQERRQFLPTFPNQSNQSINQTPLLLANVSAHKLSTIELARRSFNAYENPLNSNLLQQVPSYIHYLFESLFSDLSQRLHIDSTILNYNLYRLHHIIKVFIWRYRSYERSTILYDHHFQLPTHEQYLRMLNQKELLILLEYFLQMDVDLFFLKTCTGRSIETSKSINQLFCTDEITNYYHYDMKSCQQLYCTLCQSKQDSTSTKNLVSFSTGGHKHCFLNKYEAILNCPANCQTNNIVYALTCVCGEYDYIGSTQYTLSDILQYHRQHTNRIIIEYLLNGEPFSNLCTCTKSQIDKERANNMRLYQHFTHCSKSLQLFLEHNPNYWCFIPMKINDAQFDDFSSLTLTLSNSEQQNTIVDHYLVHLPKPPLGYTFSKRQQDEQRQFFQKFNPQQHHLYSTLDFYRTSIVAVLPDPCSTMLRHMIEILFITHAETKLNSMNLFTSDTNLLYGLPYAQNRVWCENLTCPSLNHCVPTTNCSTFSNCE
ncbi:unnamed protein product [Rotaria sp. Silwood2]|nr:unnamed protein product [Rotaria sp. Silwood2]